MNPQLNIFEGRALRDQGIQRAQDKAEKDSPGWNTQSWEMFQIWLSGWPKGYVFLIEDFRFAAKMRGLPDPHSNRAFGGLARRAGNDGLIRAVGMKQVRNSKAHACYATQWQKV